MRGIIRYPKPVHAARTTQDPPRAEKTGDNEWSVPSASSPGTSRRVMLTEGVYSCDCPAFLHRGTCKHVAVAREAE